MILKKLVLVPLINQTLLTSGLDSREEQLKQFGSTSWFDNFPDKVIYNFNSRGYRDAEWPEDLDELKKAVWCIGDSFTVGLGSKREHTWSYVLQEKIKTRTINISMDGASNHWIAGRAIDIVNEINPNHIVIHWSYTHRREIADPEDTRCHMSRRIDHAPATEEEDAEDILKNISRVEDTKRAVNIIHSFIPHFHFRVRQIDLERKIFDSFPKAKIIPAFEKVDLARDSHHYDIKTAREFVDKIIKFM